MGWSPYVESEPVAPTEGVSDDSLFRTELLDAINAVHLQLKLLNTRFEELGQTTINERDVP
jgi:hypothetical protein